MDKVRIPLSVDPVRNAGKRLTYDGVIPSESLTRLNELLVRPCPDPAVSLEFGIDEQNIRYFRGHVKVDVELSCQRCGEPMTVQLAAEFQYAPVQPERSADELPEHYEAAVLNELGEIIIHGLVEDELLVVMPQVAKHQPEDCAIDINAMSWGKLPQGEEKQNPFEVLKKLKK